MSNQPSHSITIESLQPIQHLCDGCKGVVSEARQLWSLPVDPTKDIERLVDQPLEPDKACIMCLLLDKIPLRGYGGNETVSIMTLDDETQSIMYLNQLVNDTKHLGGCDPVFVTRSNYSINHGFLILLKNLSRDAFTQQLTAGPKVNYQLITEWLDTCRSDPDHQDTCSTPSSDQPAILRLIDIADSNKVVPAPETVKYVALSYVWGGAQTGSFPQVVIDSIEVANTGTFGSINL
ncbi:hypothetical protein QBC38DRAFT_488031 [Podospora fimiseda]|uniref:Heterokaryon incompatibility domain-containing protein n=1 Tax=Podospora fimiseda TaxID=252190 RepID=A0AAN7BH83_9PEZI|nr:hypothetical protein QBC38DRAFT_488031 [Podospora fimiseda]